LKSLRSWSKGDVAGRVEKGTAKNVDYPHSGTSELRARSGIRGKECPAFFRPETRDLGPLPHHDRKQAKPEVLCEAHPSVLPVLGLAIMRSTRGSRQKTVLSLPLAPPQGKTVLPSTRRLARRLNGAPRAGADGGFMVPCEDGLHVRLRSRFFFVF